MYILKCGGLGPTTVEETDTLQDFVDLLDSEIIKPLADLKASPRPLVPVGRPVLITGALKETKYERRKRIEEDLKSSATVYADYAEKRISKLQQAYLKKHYPRQYSQSTSTDVLQRPQEFTNNTFGGTTSARIRGRREDLRQSEPAEAQPEQGIT